MSRSGNATLSSCSMRFFAKALRGDVSDIQQGTTSEGIHLGAIAGRVGLIEGDVLRLNLNFPHVPADDLYRYLAPITWKECASAGVVQAFIIALFPFIVVAYYLLARSEVRKLEKEFGDAHRGRVPMFIPRWGQWRAMTTTDHALACGSPSGTESNYEVESIQRGAQCTDDTGRFSRPSVVYRRRQWRAGKP